MRHTLGVLLLLVFAGWMHGQDSRGSIRGRVTDTSGAVVPGASVTATNVNTNAHASGETNHEGNYEIPYLLPGAYRVAWKGRASRKRFEKTSTSVSAIA